jgi:hypothetical protein
MDNLTNICGIGQLYERWFMAYPLMRDYGPFGHMSWGIRHITNTFLCTYAGALLYCQGTGRHEKQEVEGFIKEVVGVLDSFAAASLAKLPEDAKEPFWILCGADPTEADFCVYGTIAGLLSTCV